MHGIQKKLKKERRKHQISAYNTCSVDLNRSRHPTTLDAAILLYTYTSNAAKRREKKYDKIK